MRNEYGLDEVGESFEDKSTKHSSPKLPSIPFCIRKMIISPPCPTIELPIAPQKCMPVHKEHILLKDVSDEDDIEFDIEKKLIELASKQDLEILAVSERIMLNSKKKRRNMFSLFRRSPLETLSVIVKYHPLTFYGFVGMGILLTAMGSGFYTVYTFLLVFICFLLFLYFLCFG